MQVPISKQPRTTCLGTMLIRAHTKSGFLIRHCMCQHCSIVQQKCHHPYPVPLLYATTTTTTIVIVLLLIPTATYCRLEYVTMGGGGGPTQPSWKSTYKVHTTGA